MAELRRLCSPVSAWADPCGRCGAVGCPWDRIAGAPMCPDCQEALAVGEGPVLRARMEPGPCAICRRAGTLSYLTQPLRALESVEIDLCGGHFEALLGRRLDRRAYNRLAGLFQAAGVDVRQVFLLHEAFYDPRGKPLQPVPETW